MDGLILILSNVANSFLTGFVAWFFARRKNNADAKKSELDNVEDAIAIWREMAQQLAVELKSLREENKVLAQEVKKLRLSNNKIVKALDTITSENVAAVVAELKKDLGHDS